VDRAQKKEWVADLNKVFSETQAVVVTHYKGLTVAEITDLRNQMRDGGASFKVTKNRLTRLALEGTKCAPLADLFKGPTAIAFSDDPVAAAKVASSYAKDNDNLVVLGGMMGETVLDVEGVKALAAMPSIDELRARIIGMLGTPATRVATVLQAPATQVARVIGAYSEKGEAA